MTGLTTRKLKMMKIAQRMLVANGILAPFDLRMPSKGRVWKMPV
jgi:hypothetical protein